MQPTKNNGKLYLMYQADERFPKVEMTLSPHAPLAEVLDSMGVFLLAAGYVFDGIIDVVPAYNDNFEGGEGDIISEN